MEGKPSSNAAAGDNPLGVLGDLFNTMAPLKLPLQQLAEIQSDYVKRATEVWNQSLGGFGQQPDHKPAPIADRRFGASEWVSNPAAAFTAQMYLLNARALMQMADSVEADAKTKVGSSRVDLQACKLEYSIVSPK